MCLSAYSDATILMKRSILTICVSALSFALAVFCFIYYDCFWRISILLTAWSGFDDSSSSCNTYTSEVSARTVVERFEMVARQYFAKYPDTEMAIYEDLMTFPSLVLQRRNARTGRYFYCCFYEANDSRGVYFRHSSEKWQNRGQKVKDLQTIDECIRWVALFSER